MAASKSYFPRSNIYFSGDRTAPIGSDSMFELYESDVWNVSFSPEFHKTMPSSQISKKQSSLSAEKRAEAGRTTLSLPVNVPDWSKIVKEDYRENRRRDNDDDDFGEEDSGDGDRIPPYEFLAMASAIILR